MDFNGKDCVTSVWWLHWWYQLTYKYCNTIHCWSTPALLGVVPQAVPSQQELYPLIRLVRGVEEDNADGWQVVDSLCLESMYWALVVKLGYVSAFSNLLIMLAGTAYTGRNISRLPSSPMSDKLRFCVFRSINSIRRHYIYRVKILTRAPNKSSQAG